ncbi:hypothetical protein LAZ67_1007859 [Cordylochernes scorpioides]|uniref:G-protein coupled receptors family 1 profile domain-containing protein n=1 Tax=Cordylochernes scorpioides TaxID=51811 RepID=A0ABY6K4F9_9ARAC|nr:hypothetical protein LAZ67_1007859 [Cordylochernes scorpioides]
MEESPYLEFREQSRFWIQRVLVPAIMAVGVAGNAVTIVVLTRRRMRSSTHTYLAALAFFDLLYLVLTFLLSLAHYPQFTECVTYLRMMPVLIMLADGASNSSVWLTVSFTLERYVAVSHPIRGKLLCTESRARKVVLAVGITCFAITLPTPFEWTVEEYVDPTTNQTKVISTFSELGRNPVYRTVYYWLTVVVFIFIPCMLLAVFNAFLVRSVHVSTSRRRTMTRCKDDSSRQENRVTVMLICVVLLFLVCQLPTAAILLYTSLASPMDRDTDLLVRGLGNIFNFLMAVNAAGNFVLYCLLSNRYRRTFLQVFCPCLKGRLSQLHSVYQNTVQSVVQEPGASDIVHLERTKVPPDTIISSSLASCFPCKSFLRRTRGSQVKTCIVVTGPAGEETSHWNNLL